jgi:hypothetical protein
MVSTSWHCGQLHLNLDRRLNLTCRGPIRKVDRETGNRQFDRPVTVVDFMGIPTQTQYFAHFYLVNIDIYLDGIVVVSDAPCVTQKLGVGPMDGCQVGLLFS